MKNPPHVILFLNVPPAQMARAASAEELDAITLMCKSSWSSTAIVSALLSGISIIPLTGFAAAAGPNGRENMWTDPWMLAMLYVSVLAFLGNLCVVMVCTALIINIDQVFGEIVMFLEDWSGQISNLPTFFNASIFLILMQILIYVTYTADGYHVYLLGSLIIAASIYMILTGLSISAYSTVRGRLNERLKMLTDGLNDSYKWCTAKSLEVHVG